MKERIHRFKPQKKRDTLLFKLLLLVLGLHAAGLIIFGGMIISEVYLSPEETFVPPPPAEEYVEPVKVPPPPTQTNKQQSQSAASQMIKRIQVPQAKMAGVSMATINLPSSDIAGTSIASGAAPKGIGNVQIPMQNVSLMGLGGKTEKIVIVIDASRYMMSDEKGALNTYNIIKKDIKALIDSLPPVVLFNVIAFSIPSDPKDNSLAINIFNPSGLVSASNDNKAKLISWLDPINSSLENLEVKNNYKPKFPLLAQAPNSHDRDNAGYKVKTFRQYRVYQAAIEQNPDTIYILTDGWTAPNKIMKPWTDAEKDTYAKRLASAKAAFDVKVAEYKASQTEESLAAAAEASKEKLTDRKEARAEANAKAKAWIEAENAKRKKLGKSLYVGTVEQVVREQNLYKNVKVNRGPVFIPPPQGKNRPYSAAEIMTYYKNLLSKERGRPTELPVFNMILFKGKAENITEKSKVAEAWAKLHKGRIKVLVGTDI